MNGIWWEDHWTRSIAKIGSSSDPLCSSSGRAMFGRGEEPLGQSQTLCRAVGMQQDQKPILHLDVSGTV